MASPAVAEGGADVVAKRATVAVVAAPLVVNLAWVEPPAAPAGLEAAVAARC